MAYSKIKALCGCISVCLWLGMIVIPLTSVVYWSLPHLGVPVMSAHGWLGYSPTWALPVDFWLHPISAMMRWLLGALEMIPAAFQVASLFLLWRLFTFYRQDVIFSHTNVRLIRWVGILMLVWQLVRPLYDMLFSLVVSFSMQGQHFMAMSLGNHDIAAMITGVMIIIISTVMQQGLLLQQDHSLTV